MLLSAHFPHSLLFLCACCTNVPNIHSIFLFMELKFFSHFHFCNSIAAMCILGLAGPKGMRIFHFNRDYQIVFQKVFIKLYYHLVPKYYFPHTFAKLLKFCSNLMDEAHIIEIRFSL